MFLVQTDIGSAVDAFFRTKNGQQMLVRSSLLLEDQDPAHWASYAFPMSDPDGVGLFELAEPAAPAAQYFVLYRERADPNPLNQPNALITDPELGGEAWDASVAGVAGVVPVVGAGQIRQGDTASVTIAVAPGSLTGRTALRFAAKIVPWQRDPDAEIEVDEDLGLTVLRGEAAASSLGSLTANALASTVTLSLAAGATAALNPDLPLLCAVKAAYGATWTEVGEVTIAVLAGRVLAVA